MDRPSVSVESSAPPSGVSAYDALFSSPEFFHRDLLKEFDV